MVFWSCDQYDIIFYRTSDNEYARGKNRKSKESGREHS